ncbi:MAG: rod shape-determining protein RodA [Alphaproteobacteria bacterium]
MVPYQNNNYAGRISQKLVKFPYFMLSIIFIISSVGFLMMYAAANGSFFPWASKQITNFIIFFVVMLIVAVTNIRFWYRISYLAYGITLFLLILVEIKGHTAMGATRWINFGLFKLQPSELMKLCLVLALARYFHDLYIRKVANFIYLIPPLIMTLIPFIFISKQPDLGTGIILILVSGMMFFIAGVRIWKFLLVIVSVLVLSPIAWNMMHDYQKQRILTFLNPESNRLGSGYNIIQSKISIGSGGFFGKGLVQGSQSQLNFLPEHQTDFIFAMLAEELGFIGSITLIFLYCLLICYGMFIAVNCKNHYGRLLAAGVNIIFFLHIFINIGMVMGLLPVVGVPLPLLSYGRTMMMTILIGFGLILNVRIHSNYNISPNSAGFI